jgi:radical SAM superfamily enzyme with C-terminal helix-hairpin-helix motif
MTSRAARSSIGTTGDKPTACICELRLYRPCPSIVAGVTAFSHDPSFRPQLSGRITDS